MERPAHLSPDPDTSGGAAAIAQIVTRLYERTIDDPELAPYFHTTDIEVQRRKRV